MINDRAASRPRLLVLENDASACDRVCEAVRKLLPDLACVERPDSDSALAALCGTEARPPHLVVAQASDWRGFLASVRDVAALRELFALVVVEPGEAADGWDGLCGGPGDFLVRPWRPEELCLRLVSGLRQVDAARRLAERVAELDTLASRHTEFLSWVSHEIRTPLAAILSSANILVRYGRKQPESVERFARVIHQEGQRLTRLINSVLDLAKIEAGQVEWRFAPASLNGILTQVRESFIALAGERSLQLDVSFCPEPDTVVVDRDKLTQVLTNLVSNAIKHSPDASTVHLRALPLAGGGVRLEVEDCGSGIPAGQEERIFERFQQLENGDERSGTGLGLTIAREIVSHHGGQLWAEPGRASGALFVVELPAREAQTDSDGPVR